MNDSASPEEKARYQAYLASRKPSNPVFLAVLEQIAKDESIPRDKVIEIALSTTESLLENHYPKNR